MQRGCEYYMREFSYTITNEYDLAAGPALDLIKLAGMHDCKTYIVKDNQAADISKLFVVLSIGTKCGDTIKFVTEGADESRAIDRIGNYVRHNM